MRRPSRLIGDDFCLVIASVWRHIASLHMLAMSLLIRVENVWADYLRGRRASFVTAKASLLCLRHIGHGETWRPSWFRLISGETKQSILFVDFSSQVKQSKGAFCLSTPCKQTATDIFCLQWFFLLFDPELVTSGRNLMDGRYSTFGYVLKSLNMKHDW